MATKPQVSEAPTKTVLEQEFVKNKDTKNMVKYDAANPASMPISNTVYIWKTTFPGGAPAKLKMTVEAIG